MFQRIWLLEYGEKRVLTSECGNKIEQGTWNSLCSKLEEGILSVVDQNHIKPGAKVLYLGTASGTTISHVSDIVSSGGLVYEVESTALVMNAPTRPEKDQCFSYD